ncbi:MAG: hypothetical protein KDA42_08110 [Planctomycetales bacterium]|nr:hypothetical protein [Planctomycetales bacterium]
MYAFRNAITALALLCCLLLFTQSVAAQTYGGGEACCTPTNAGGECCAPSLRPAACYAPHWIPSPTYPQSYAEPQPATTSVYQPPYNVGASQFSYRPLLPIVPQASNVEVGRGMFGQPAAYVPGQPIRNLFRYMSPF